MKAYPRCKEFKLLLKLIKTLFNRCGLLGKVFLFNMKEKGLIIFICPVLIPKEQNKYFIKNFLEILSKSCSVRPPDNRRREYRKIKKDKDCTEAVV